VASLSRQKKRSDANCRRAEGLCTKVDEIVLVQHSGPPCPAAPEALLASACCHRRITDPGFPCVSHSIPSHRPSLAGRHWHGVPEEDLHDKGVAHRSRSEAGSFQSATEPENAGGVADVRAGGRHRSARVEWRNVTFRIRRARSQEDADGLRVAFACSDVERGHSAL